MMFPPAVALGAGLLLCCSAGTLLAQPPTVYAMESDPPARPYAVTEQREPCADYEPLRRPWFADVSGGITE